MTPQPRFWAYTQREKKSASQRDACTPTFIAALVAGCGSSRVPGEGKRGPCTRRSIIRPRRGGGAAVRRPRASRGRCAERAGRMREGLARGCHLRTLGAGTDGEMAAARGRAWETGRPLVEGCTFPVPRGTRAGEPMRSLAPRGYRTVAERGDLTWRGRAGRGGGSVTPTGLSFHSVYAS